MAASFTTGNAGRRGPDADTIREQARGQWPVILEALGADSALLDGKHHPCPSCGGRDRFRFDDREGTGSYICNQCGAGDGFDLAGKLLGLDPKRRFPAILELVAERRGNLPSPSQEIRSWQKTTDSWATILPVPDDAPDPPRHYGMGEPSRRWTYHNDRGRTLFHVCRFDKEDGSKEIFPLSFCQGADGKRQWRWKGLPAPRPLYNLDGLAARPDAWVLVCEGEKATDAAMLLFPEWVSTTSPNGSGGAGHADWSPLAGRRVVIWPDHDDNGIKYANAVTVALRQVQAASVQWLRSEAFLRLPGLPKREALPEGWDAADALAEGAGPETGRAFLDDPANLLSPRLKHTAIEAAAPVKAPPPSNLEGGITAADLLRREFPEPRWAVPGILPEGVALLGGNPKIGKSWLVLSFGLAISSGGRVMGQIPVQKGEVLYLALEDNQRRLQSRCRKLLETGSAPAPEGLHLFTEWKRLDQGGAEDLDKWLKQHPDCRLVIIDTLAKIRPGRSRNGDAYAEDYAVGAVLKPLADRHRVAVLVVHHLRKMASDDPVETLSGTMGLSGGMDGILVMQRPRGKEEVTLFVTGRDIANEKTHALKWHQESGEWELLGDASTIAATEEQRAILDAIRGRAGHGLTIQEIADAIGKNHESARKIVGRMVKTGTLFKGGTYHNPRYSLPAITYETESDALFISQTSQTSQIDQTSQTSQTHYGEEEGIWDIQGGAASQIDPEINNGKTISCAASWASGTFGTFGMQAEDYEDF